jgi:hypothetical protein
MPFGLKNAGATYQRTMQRCLKDQIGRNVHAYVDDIAVMTRKGSDLISDLTETFENLRRYKMMLNPLKCVFGVPAGKLLGFIVSNRGIEVNPGKNQGNFVHKKANLSQRCATAHWLCRSNQQVC